MPKFDHLYKLNRYNIRLARSTEKKKMTKSQAQENQTPAGYPTEDHPPAAEKKCWPRSKKKGDRGFIEGCLFALCCCWLCEACF